jgi:hypothetical protein
MICLCPQCGDPVRLPARGASPQALVRCPLCHESFPLSAVLDRLPPALEVIESPIEVENDDHDVAGSAVGSWSLPAPHSLHSPRAEHGVDWAPQAAFRQSADSSAGVIEALPSRPARRRVHPIALLVQWVFGGVIGVVGALLLCWWVLDRDPGFGPQVARYLPWVVPEKFGGSRWSQESAPRKSAESLIRRDRVPQPGPRIRRSDEGSVQQDRAASPTLAPRTDRGTTAPASDEVVGEPVTETLEESSTTDTERPAAAADSAVDSQPADPSSQDSADAESDPPRPPEDPE